MQGTSSSSQTSLTFSFTYRLFNIISQGGQRQPEETDGKSELPIPRAMPNEVNRKPLELIQHVVVKQSVQDMKLSKSEKKEREEKLTNLLNGDIDMAAYISNEHFDPCQEILKEK